MCFNQKIRNIFRKFRFLKFFGYVLISLLSAVCAATVLMIISYSLNTDKIKQNINYSLVLYEDKSTYTNFAPYIPAAKIDNFGDTFLLNEAGFSRGDTFRKIVYNAMYVPRYDYLNMESPVHTLRKAYSDISQDPLKNDAMISDNSKYWHGNLVFLKPLFLLMNYSDIIILNMCIQLILLIALAAELSKKGGNNLLYAFLSGIFLLNPITAALCIEISNIYCICLISMFIMLKKEIYNSPDYLYFFLWTGIITVFFDLNTYPAVALGFNLALMQILTDNPLKERLKQIISSCFIWAVGYVGMWSSKWILGNLLTDFDVIKDAFFNVAYRMYGADPDFNYTVKDIIICNITSFKYYLVYIILGFTVLIFIYRLISRKYRFNFDAAKYTALVFIGILPFVYMCLIQNHCFTHPFLTHRNLTITIIVLIYILISLNKKIGDKNTEKQDFAK